MTLLAEQLQGGILFKAPLNNQTHEHVWPLHHLFHSTLYRLVSSVWSNIFFVIATSTGKANVASEKAIDQAIISAALHNSSEWTYSAWIWSNIVCLSSRFMLCVITMMLDENVWSLALAEGKLNLPQELITVISRNIFFLSHENDQPAFSKKLHSGDLFLLDVVKQ